MSTYHMTRLNGEDAGYCRTTQGMDGKWRVEIDGRVNSPLRDARYVTEWDALLAVTRLNGEDVPLGWRQNPTATDIAGWGMTSVALDEV